MHSTAKYVLTRNISYWLLDVTRSLGELISEFVESSPIEISIMCTELVTSHRIELFYGQLSTQSE